MSLTFKPREYQKYFFDETFKEIKKGNKNICIESYTGTGKTYMSSMIIKEFIKNNKSTIFVAPRLTLINQTKKALKYLDSIQIIQGQNKYDENGLLYVASLKTIIRRKFKTLNPALIIIDEAHIGKKGKSQKKLFDKFPNAIFLSLTATAFDSYGHPYTNFDRIIRYKTKKWYVKKKYLCDVECYAPYTPSFKNIKRIAGEFSTKDMDRELNNTSIVGNIVSKTKDYLFDKKTLVFCINIAHAKLLTKYFNDIGFKAKSYHSDLSLKKRNKLEDDFRNNKLNMLVSVLALAEGIDIPDVNALLIARPIGSVSLIHQVYGRGLRGGKDICYIIDTGGCMKRLGYPTNEPKRIIKNTTLKKCKKCNSPIRINSIKVREIKGKIYKISEYKCENNHKYNIKIELSPEICENCSLVIKNKKTKFKELDDKYVVYSICSNCGNKNIKKEIPKINIEKLIKIECENDSLETLTNKIKNNCLIKDYKFIDKYLNFILKKLNDENKHAVMACLYKCVKNKYTQDQVKEKIMDVIVNECLKTGKFDNIGTTLFNRCAQQANTFKSIIGIYNTRCIERNKISDKYTKMTINKINSFIEEFPDSKKWIKKVIRTKCTNILKKGHKMTSLYFFIDYLKEQELKKYIDNE